MFRLGFLSLFGMISIALASTAADPADDQVSKALSVQTAMHRARLLLNEMNAQQAVKVLEDQLPKVNGNTPYLVLLRDAYRAYIRDLHLAGQPDLAKRYLDRLCILDPSAVNDASLRPAVDTPPRNFQPEPPKQAKTTPFPNFKLPAIPSIFGKKEDAKGPPIVKAATIRMQSEDASVEDPFDRKNQRETTPDAGKTALALELQQRGAAEFKNERYSDARICFEQAYQSDQTSLDAYRDQWAYCIIRGVSEAMERPEAKLPELQKQVEFAIGMAPTKMMAVGQALMEQMDKRGKGGAGRPVVTAAVSAVKHLGTNKEGWQVAETAHFLIFHRQDNAFAERVAQIAETTRKAMYRKWFDSDGVEWRPTCELILHPTAAAYTQMTGVPSNSPGHSRIEADPSGRVIARRMDLRLDITSMMEAVLPHETTHVVLAGMFGATHVPRWADEGVAVLSEPNEKIDLHRRNLLKNHSDGHLFGLKELMELKDYPESRRIGAFYAQSVVLVEFLTQQRGPKTFTDFVKDGIRHGYETSLQRHYKMTFTQLDQVWRQQVLNNTGRLAATK